MALERAWAAVIRPFSSNGTSQGTFQVANYTGLFIKQQVSLVSNTQPALRGIEIKRIDPDGTVYVGPMGSDILLRSDVSAFLVSDSAQIVAAEQKYSALSPDMIFNAVYERDPVKAWRSELVDPQGNPSGTASNPIAVDVVSGGGGSTIPSKWTEIDLTYDINDNLTQASFLNGATVEQVLDLTYDANSNLTKVVAED